MIIDIHSHPSLRSVDIAKGLLPCGLVSILQTKVGYFLLSRLLCNLNPFNDEDILNRVVQMIKTMEKKSSVEIITEEMSFYPSDTKIVCLTMDMAFMGAGKVPRSYELQLLELAQARVEYPNIIPFIHIDPRREGYYSLFLKAVEQWGYRGVKLYPPLGYFPYDDRLDCIYDYCEKHNLPVVTHCTADNPIYFRGSDKELKELLKKSKTPITGKTRKELCANFTHPSNYEYVMQKHPELKIDCAHFGRENDWDRICKDLMRRYKGFYCDIAYVMMMEEHWPMFKILMTSEEDIELRGKILFGTDFPLNQMEGTLKQMTVKFRAYMGEEIFTRIGTTNNSLFLS